MDNSGNVGIATATPTQKLDVRGSVRVDEHIYDEKNEKGTAGQVLSTTATGVDWVDAATDNLGNHTATQNIKLSGKYLSGDGGNEGVFVDNSGNVGIATGTPTQKLDVRGSARIDQFIYDEKNEKGTAGQVLSTTATGIDWINVPSDNLGNHTATVNVRLNNKYLSNDGGNEGIRIDNAGTTTISGAGSHIIAGTASVATVGNQLVTDGQLKIGHGGSNDGGGGIAFQRNQDNYYTGFVGYHDGTANEFLFSNSKDAGAYFRWKAAWNVPDAMSLYSTGLRIGGSGTPTQKLEVFGSARIDQFIYDEKNEKGTAGQVLSTTATGIDWVDAATDNLGNHTATQNIKLSGRYLSGDGGNEGIFVGSTGDVGIGTNALYARKLDVTLEMVE